VLVWSCDGWCWVGRAGGARWGAALSVAMLLVREEGGHPGQRQSRGMQLRPPCWQRCWGLTWRRLLREGEGKG
jgi:hypothetical protein